MNREHVTLTPQQRAQFPDLAATIDAMNEQDPAPGAPATEPERSTP